MTKPMTYAGCNCGRVTDRAEYTRNDDFVFRTYSCPTRLFMVSIVSEAPFSSLRLALRPHSLAAKPLTLLDSVGVIIAVGDANESPGPAGSLWYFTWLSDAHGLRLPAEGPVNINAASYGLNISLTPGSDWNITIDTSEETDPSWQNKVK